MILAFLPVKFSIAGSVFTEYDDSYIYNSNNTEVP